MRAISPKPAAVVHKGFDPEETLMSLTLQEKIALVSGSDFWHTVAVPRLGIPAIRLSDGPNGVRGTKFFDSVPAACLPCGTALGATWNTTLLREVGELMGCEAVAKGASCILGPTINIPRGPLGGRGFESFSEDPVLAGNLASASVRGIQSTRVAAALKHFVCNDQENKRMSSNSVLTERSLREIYLMPFQIVQRDAKPMSFMTAYNQINGIHCSEHQRLLQGIVRDEWGFDGLVLSDWYGTYSAAESIKAGLDLEMPGPSYARERLIHQALRRGKLLPHHLDACVRRVLQLVKRVTLLGIPERAEEKAMDTPETAAFLRKIAAESIVLLKNDKSILPLKKGKKTAVIGPNATLAAYCGGGSASLRPYYAVKPLDGITAQCSQVQYELGAPGWKWLPLLSESTITVSGDQGVQMTVYLDPPSTKNRKSVDQLDLSTSNVALYGYKHANIDTNLFLLRF